MGDKGTNVNPVLIGPFRSSGQTFTGPVKYSVNFSELFCSVCGKDLGLHFVVGDDGNHYCPECYNSRELDKVLRRIENKLDRLLNQLEER